jgi:hypothetical protein
MAFSDHHKTGYSLVFRNQPAIGEYIRLCYLVHSDLIRKAVQEMKNKIKIIDPIPVTLRQIEHKMRPEVGLIIHRIQALLLKK